VVAEFAVGGRVGVHVDSEVVDAAQLRPVTSVDLVVYLAGVAGDLG
jgi:hypothetical protein